MGLDVCYKQVPLFYTTAYIHCSDRLVFCPKAPNVVLARRVLGSSNLTGCFFSGPAQKSSKYGTGPIQKRTITKFTENGKNSYYKSESPSQRLSDFDFFC